MNQKKKDITGTFIDAYLANGRNITDAYIAAFPGTPRPSAGTLGSRMFKRVETQAELKKRQEKITEASTITVQSQLAELERIKAIALTQPKPDTRAAIQAIDVQNRMLGLYAPEKTDIAGYLLELEKRKTAALERLARVKEKQMIDI